jgi:2-keto-4-pentenoate hydratase/2-oxohepta-3-ene-1,7-dioic acid hydratase in catechol pathway
VKLAAYAKDGERRIGAVVGERVIPTRWTDFDALFEESDPLQAVLSTRLDASAAVIPDRLFAPVRSRPQIIATGGNYADHADEARSIIDVKEPIFISYLPSAVIGPDQPIVIPTLDTKADYEVELAVIMATPARSLRLESSMNHVFGYTILNDISAREVMVREKFQILLSKCPDTFCPIGPVVVTADEIGDPHTLRIATYLNGELRQDSNTAAMVARIPEILVAITRTITLGPGDIVSTGSPAGIGFFRKPPEFLQPGDSVVAEVERIGRLTNPVVAGW